MNDIKQATIEASEFAQEKLNEGYTVRLETKRTGVFKIFYSDENKQNCGYDTFEYSPPAPEYEAGIVGTVSGGFNDLEKLVRFHNDTYLYHDNFTPLPIYTELEQTKKALENMGKEYCEAVNSKQKGCSECPIKDRCSIHDDTNHDGLVSHFLKEARDGKG